MVSSLSETSLPAYSFAPPLHSQAMVLAGHSASMWSFVSSWLTGFIPEALMRTCISVATVPGLRPTTLTPVFAASLWAHWVSMWAPALALQ